MRGELSQRGDATAAVAAFWTHTEPIMRRIARRLSDDPDVQDELVQEGLIKLWISDPTRYDLSSFAGRTYLRRAIVNRMRRVGERYWRDVP